MRHLYVKIFIGFCYFLTVLSGLKAQPCFPGEITTAAYAEGGTSSYKEQVLWMTWGSNNDANYPYGQHNTPLENGDASYASIDIGGGKYLCIQAMISDLTAPISSYAPGNYNGDSMDDLYNIGGTGTDNQLVNGIQNGVYGGTVSFKVTCKATLDGQPVRLAGLVLGDGESLDGDGEYFHVTADGKWTIVELQKNIDEGPYQILKSNVNEGGIIKQNIRFVKGNNRNTAAVSFLTFDATAYGTFSDNYEVSFDVTLKGTGITALVLGLITINADGGDAPESYGAPLHLFEGTILTDDGIDVDDIINLNTEDYDEGALVQSPSNFLGTTGPDADNGPQFSEDALGDDNNPDGPSTEEDAWPTEHKRWSYNATYKPGKTLSIDIPYNGLADAYIVGWIDFNWNGVFEESERVIIDAPAASDIVTLTWIIPEDRIAKSTYVRLRYAINEDEILSPTTVASGGEMEDHFIYILGPATTNPMLPSKVKQPTRP